jgi:hypothetical protein
LGGVGDGQGFVGVFDEAIGGTLAVGFGHQGTVGSQLKNMSFIRTFGGGIARLHFDGNDALFGLDEVVGFAGELEGFGEEGFFGSAPGTGILIDDAALGDTRTLPEPEGETEDEKTEEEEKDGHRRK